MFFSTFLNLLVGLTPFLKELILGNQSFRDAILKNKLQVATLLLFILMLGSNLYISDANRYLKKTNVDLAAKLATAEAKLKEAKTPPPQIVLTPPAKLDVTKVGQGPPPTPVIVTSPQIVTASPAKSNTADAALIAQQKEQIKELTDQLHPKKTSGRHPKAVTATTTVDQPSSDILDKLYRTQPYKAPSPPASTDPYKTSSY